MIKIDNDYVCQQFVTYCKFNTRSDPNSKTIPSTTGQITLAKRIVKDLQELGLKSWYNEQNGFALGFLPGNTSKEVSPIGLVAHLDTIDYPSEKIAPQIHPNYDGQDVILNDKENIIMHVSEFPDLKKVQGQTLITSDATTLLGADDKAGIAGLFGALKAFISQPQIERGPIYVAFGPDEEIGRGAKHFDASEFPVEFAYTLDNGQPGDIEYETFYAAAAKIEIEGTSVHPGNAYHLLVNASTLANKIVAGLPKEQVPEKTKGREGFILLTSQESTVDHAKLQLIIRDFEKSLYEKKLKFIQDWVAQTNNDLDKPRVKLTLTKQYDNIGATIKKSPTSLI